MKRFLSITLLMLVMGGQLIAKHSDEFLLGTYSYMSNSFPYFFENRELFSRYMQEMGYNSNIIETDIDDPDLPGMLQILDRYGIDAWITDRGYSPDPSTAAHYAINPLATSSYQRFEAEYLDETELNPGDGQDSRFWYASRNDKYITRVGRPKRDSKASNGYLWKAERRKDAPGYAMGDLRYRWPNVNGAYVRIGYEFNHYQMNPPNHEGEYFWITYRFRITDVDPKVKAGDPLLSFQVAGYELSGGSFSSQATALKANSEKDKSSEVHYSYEDHLSSKNKDGFVEYLLKVPYSELIDANLLREQSRIRLRLNNLNARLYWHGNCTLELDYVDIQDQVSYMLSSRDAAFKEGILNRARALMDEGPGNVSGLYAFDEPFQGQFSSFGILKDILAEDDIPMMTATYDYQSSNIVINRRKGLYYDHLDAFLKIAEPQIYSPDIYPLKPDLSFVPGVKGRDFVQDVLDDKLLSIYEAGIKYCREDPQRRFYPIVQAFGRWAKGSPDYWTSWVMPPYATQKALLYLPLVYKADGIFHYRLQAYQTEDGYGDYVGLASQKLRDRNYYAPPEVLSTTMDAIMDTNPKVFEYGRIIRDLKWMGAARIMTKKQKDAKLPDDVQIRDIYVENQRGAPYSGYIQCGFYQDDEDNGYLMLVNRRGNYFRAARVDSEGYVPPSEYEAHFPQADPQTLSIRFNAKARRDIGKYIGLMDPLDKSIICSDSQQRLSIEIPAGEARLFKVVQTIPDILEGRLTLKGDSVINSDVVLSKKARLTLHESSKLTLLPGASLTVPPGANLIMAGEIELLEAAEIKVLGYLEKKEVEIDLGKEALLTEEPRVRRSFFQRLFGIK